MPQNLPKCESLGEVTKTGSEGSLGAALNENLKIAGFVVERNTHLIRKSLWHVCECDGWVTATLPGRELVEQHGGSTEEKPWRGKHAGVSF